jgi:hypothetical protein
MANILFTSTDNTKYVSYSARELSQIEYWGGNRIVDQHHVAEILGKIQNNPRQLNLKAFHVGFLKQDEGEYRQYILDGQHRIQILRDYFKNTDVSDFDVLVAVKEFDTEDSMIEYFRVLNTTKSIPWKEDPNMIANKYIQAISVAFNTDPKKPLFRNGRTQSPFISIDKFRQALLSKHVYDWKRTPEQFVDDAIRINTEKLRILHSRRIISSRDSESKACQYGFALGLDDSFNWI